MDINKIADSYNIIAASMITILTAIFGPQWYVFATFLLLNVIDFITGCYKARKLKKESSKIGFNGIVKKFMYWLIIVIAFLMSYVFKHMGTDLFEIDLSFLVLLGWFTIACLMINEIRSIFENLVECGVKVPAILIKGLSITEKIIEDKVK